MSHLKIAICTWDVSENFSTTESFYQKLLSITETQLQKGMQIVLFPEYTGAALLSHPHYQKNGPQKLALDFWKDFAPQVQKLSKKHKALLCLGSAPYFNSKTKKIQNRAVIYASGKEILYSKQALTPWEKSFECGKKCITFQWSGLTIAPLICLDIEIPEFARNLKKKKPIDLVLAPSATSDILGSERVQRCASARAIELGAYVAVSPLLGTDHQNPLIDINVGYPQLYYPSQEVFREEIETQFKSPTPLCLESGFHVLNKEISLEKLKTMRKNIKGAVPETRPFLIKK